MKLCLPVKVSTIGFSAMLVGLLGLVFSAYFWHISQGSITAAPLQDPLIDVNIDQTSEPQTITGKPIELLIPSLNIDLTISDGAYDPLSRTWTLSKDYAHYALMTTQPNTTSGNTLIYGHNTAEVFAALPRITQGSEAKVITDNGFIFTYIYTENTAVKPEDTEVLYYSGVPRLTLQTCSGIFNQNRQLFYFNFSSVK